MFFLWAHKNSKKIEPTFELALANLIREYNVNTFYVGVLGGLNLAFLKMIKGLKKEFPHIDYIVILSGEGKGAPYVLFPDEFGTNISLKYAKSNTEYIVEKSDFIISYYNYDCSSLKILKNIDLSSKKVTSLGTLDIK